MATWEFLCLEKDCDFHAIGDHRERVIAQAVAHLTTKHPESSPGYIVDHATHQVKPQPDPVYWKGKPDAGGPGDRGV